MPKDLENASPAMPRQGISIPIVFFSLHILYTIQAEKGLSMEENSLKQHGEDTSSGSFDLRSSRPAGTRAALRKTGVGGILPN
jgi:hypothetical protein